MVRKNIEQMKKEVSLGKVLHGKKNEIHELFVFDKLMTVGNE